MLKTFLLHTLEWVKKHSVPLSFLFILLFHSWSLMRYPAPFVDEVWLISRAWAYLKTGLNFGQMDKGILEIFEGHETFFPFFQTWFYSIGLKISGAPTLLPVRIITLFFGILLLLSLFFIAKHLGDTEEALIAILLLSITQTFGGSAHLARADIIGAALGFGAIAIYISNTSSRWWLHLLSGFLAGIVFEIHPNSIIFIPALSALYFLDYSWSFIKRKEFLLFATGTALTLGIYIALHITPYPKTYFALADLFGGTARRPPILSFDFAETLNSFWVTTAYLIKHFWFASLFIFWQIWPYASSS